MSRVVRWLSRRENVIPTLLLVCLLTLAGIFIAERRVENRRHLEMDTEMMAHQIVRRVEQFVQTRLSAAESLIDQNEDSGELGAERFERLSLLTQHRFPGFQAINWIDTDGRIQWVVPPEGNEAAQGAELTNHPIAGPLLAQAAQTGMPIASPPLELMQGGAGFVTYYPVGGMGAPGGYINVVFRLEDLIERCLHRETLQHYCVCIYDGKRLVVRVCQEGDAHDPPLGVTEPLRILNRVWELEVCPSRIQAASVSPPADRATGVLAIVICFLLAGLTHTVLTRARHIQEREALNRAYVSAIPDLMYLFKRDGTLIDCTAPSEDLLFRPREEMLGRSVRQLGLPVEHVQLITDRIDEAFSRSRVQVFTYELHVPRGFRHFEGRITRCGKDRVLLIARDITARIAAERERHAFESQVQQTQKLESLGVLAGGIAHDFNNLLQGILGNAELAYLEVPPESPARESLDVISITAQRASELCSQMLAYAGQSQFRFEPVNLSHLVRDMADLLRVSVTKRAELICDLPEGLPRILGDATQLRQVVMNLLTNASEAIGAEGGKIRVRTGMSEEPDEAHVGAMVWLEVADNGCGMDEETRQRLFEPFFTTKFTGRGLGMAAVRGIITGHCGSIDVQSERGEGTTFRLLLPAHVEQRGRSDEEPIPPAPLVRNRTILFVDDEDLIRRFAERVLERAGLEVILAADGQEAVKHFDEQCGDIDLIVLDLTMPRMGGAEAFAALRAIRPDVPIIVSSGHSDEETSLQRLRPLADSFLKKPYSAGALIQRIAEILAERLPSDPARRSRHESDA